MFTTHAYSYVKYVYSNALHTFKFEPAIVALLERRVQVGKQLADLRLEWGVVRVILEVSPADGRGASCLFRVGLRLHDEAHARMMKTILDV